MANVFSHESAASAALAYIGVDMAKATFVWARHGDSHSQSLSNTQDGFESLLQALRSWPVGLIVVEATGGLERALALWLVQHGLPVAVGMAKAAKVTGASYHTYVMTGDGEMQEGSNWEAISCAAQFGLDNLTLIIDHNRLQQGATLKDTNNLAPFPAKLEAFGWDVTEINGSSMDEIVPALEWRSHRPHCIVAHTNKGQGISFMQDKLEWHHKVPNAEQYKIALTELSETL